MKPEELMIGDWVITPAGIAKVLKIDGDNNTIVICQHDGRLNGGLVDEAEPIPLTPEILEKNGFFRLGNQYNTWCMRGFNFSLDFIDGIFGYYEQGRPNNPTFATKYVHELQHALKLCGIEKTIEL